MAHITKLKLSRLGESAARQSQLGEAQMLNGELFPVNQVLRRQ